MIAFLTNLYLIVMLSGAVSNIRCSAAGIMEAIKDKRECNMIVTRRDETTFAN